MQIREVQVTPIKPNQGLVAFASFVLDGQWYMGSIGIVTRPQGGYRLVYPTKKVGDKNLAIYHPITKQQSEVIEQIVIKKYEEVTNDDWNRHRRLDHT